MGSDVKVAGVVLGGADAGPTEVDGRDCLKLFFRGNHLLDLLFSFSFSFSFSFPLTWDAALDSRDSAAGERGRAVLGRDFPPLLTESV